MATSESDLVAQRANLVLAGIPKGEDDHDPNVLWRAYSIAVGFGSGLQVCWVCWQKMTPKNRALIIRKCRSREIVMEDCGR